VQSGETIIYIASYYGTTFEAILAANGLDETSARLLRPGQELVIPSTGPVGGPVPGSTQQPPQVIHEVKSGETLISIADIYGTTVEGIMTASGLDSPDLIYVGQQLVVPLVPGTSTPTSTPTTTPTSTPGPPFPAPNLLSPPDGALFEGEEAVVLLAWASVGILREDQAYLVELETPAQIAPVTYVTQATSWRLPSELWTTGRLDTLNWWVTVVQRVDADSDGTPDWKPISLPTEERHFIWR
jgi:LysM repeat protein